jgi:CarD family transcriptional regulator
MSMPFSPGSYVVYPPHGVGRFLGNETHDVSGQQVDLLIINFERDRMTLRLPFAKVQAAGLRSLSSQDDMDKALQRLKVKTRQKRSMWSRRAQEYENKINSGDPFSIAEVVRDLFRLNPDVDQSYSERQIYQTALGRLVRELAAVENIQEDEALKKLETFLKVA